MNAITFDTHRFVKKLTAAGMPEAQAEVLAEQQRDLIEDKLATKRDLHELNIALKRDIHELELRLKIWVGSMAVVIIGVQSAIIGIFAAFNFFG